MTAYLRAFVHLAFAAMLLMTSGAAFAGDNFPGNKPDRRTLKTQEKVDLLFEKGDYERAMFIYRHELAPLGDKFAQYMVGYMHYSGRGVPEDPVRASAWYRLAAQRGEKSFVKVRDVLMNLMNDEQKARSDTVFLEIRGEMGDIVLMTNLVNEDLALLRRRRGSEFYLQEDLERANFGHNVADYRRSAVRLEGRLEYLIEIVAADQLASQAERELVDSLEAEVRREINVFEASLK